MKTRKIMYEWPPRAHPIVAQPGKGRNRLHGVENGLNLRADCESCLALCCVVPAFSASADFAINKPAGQPCPNLRPDSRCGIHTSLRERGFRGCTVYDCFGAGQQVSQVTFAGQDWRGAPRTAKQMCEVSPVMRDLHELLWYLGEALTITAARSLHGGLSRAVGATERLTGQSPEALLELDTAAHRAGVNDLLLAASELARAGFAHRKNHRGDDLIGADLSGADLRGASLRGAYLIGADLRDADLRMTDVIGADFRDADIRGTDLTGAIYLIQSQLDAARGDSSTTVPPSLTCPVHWSDQD